MKYCEQYLKYKKRYIEMCSNYNLKKIVIFDFDETISNISVPDVIFNLRKKHIYTIDEAVNILSKNNNILSKLFQDYTFIKQLRNFKKQGVLFVIASFGIKSAIKMILKKYNIDDIFDNIFTPIDFGLEEGFDHNIILNGKNKMISLIKNIYMYNITKNNNKIILIDDNKNNINKAMIKYSVLHVKGNKGLQLNDRDKVFKLINYNYTLDCFKNQG